MAQEPKTRKKSARLEKKKQQSQPPVSFVPSKRAHLAQKSLPDFVPPPISTPSENSTELIYFFIYEELAWICAQGEKTGKFDAGYLKNKALERLLQIRNITKGLKNIHVLHLFNHLAELISEHLIYPNKLKLKHLKYFLSQKTKLDQAIMEEDGYSTSVPDKELMPLISSFAKLTIHTKSPVEKEILKFIYPDSMDNTDDLESPWLSEDLSEELEDLGPLPDEFPSELFPDAPKLVLVNSSWERIMAMMQKEEKTRLKRPGSPSSEETLSVTPPPFKKITLEDDQRIAKQLSLGLRTKERKNYYEEKETPKINRNMK